MNSTNSVQMQSEKLLKSYTIDNLTKITSLLIDLYKARNYQTLKNIAHGISEYTGFNTKDNSINLNKYFSKLIIMYHPDKIISYQNIINKAVLENNHNALKLLNHIFVTTDLINNYHQTSSSSAEKATFYADDNFVPDPELYADLNNYVFDISELEEPESQESWNTEFDDFDCDGSLEIDHELDDFFGVEGKSFFEIYQTQKLPDKQRISICNANMINLDGIESFKNLTHLDLSRNKINDIYNLCIFDKLQELYLSDNKIYNLFPLCTLKSLRILELSNNQIDDVSHLEKLVNLEFVNLIGNPLSIAQVNRLKKRVKVVLF